MEDKKRKQEEEWHVHPFIYSNLISILKHRNLKGNEVAGSWWEVEEVEMTNSFILHLMPRIVIPLHKSLSIYLQIKPTPQIKSILAMYPQYSFEKPGRFMFGIALLTLQTPFFSANSLVFLPPHISGKIIHFLLGRCCSWIFIYHCFLIA